MSDDEKRASDPGRVSAPVPDFDEDVTTLTPGHELARWRQLAARDEKPAIGRAPVAPSSRPLRPGGAALSSAHDKTPARGTPLGEATPAKGNPLGEATPAKGNPLGEATPAKGTILGEAAAPHGGRAESTPTRAIAVPGFGGSPLRDEPVSRSSLRDAPVSFPGRASAPPAVARSAPPAARPIPAPHPLGRRAPPSPGSPDDAPAVSGGPALGLPDPRALSAEAGVAAEIASPDRSSEAPTVPLPAGVPPPDARGQTPALAPPPPSFSLPPRNDPSIPPAPPLGFDPPAPSRPQSEAKGGLRGVGVVLGLLVVGGGLAAAGYLASTGMFGPLPFLDGLGAARTPGPTATPVAVPLPTSPDPSAGAPPAPLPAGGSAAALATADAAVAAVVEVPPTVAPTPGPPPAAVPDTLTNEPEVPASVAELLAAADAALRGGDAAAALEGYRAVIAADPHDPYGYAGAARASLALDEPEDAISFATRAVAHRQRRASFRVLLGDAYEAHREHARARQEWQMALELEPGNAEARRRLE